MTTAVSLFGSLTVLAAALLAACGGGGGGSDGGPSGSGDPTLPTAALSAPAAFARGLSGTQQVSATATDDTGVSSVEFQIDGQPLGPADTTAPYTVEVDTTAYAAGQHVLRARARDAAGNASPWSSATVEFGGDRNRPAGFTLEEDWVGGLVDATAFAPTPDGRFLVAEQGGALRVVKNGELLPGPFVQLPNVNRQGERGLIGVAVDPGFASNGFVYLHYTTTQGGVHNRVSRFVASGDAASGPETVLLDLPPLSGATNHNGGALHFGTDGKLYVAVGDNANDANAQDLTRPLGKLLRLEPADGSAPADNPFVGTGFNDPRIWAYGLRNPFTFAVRPEDGRIHINDVGQNAWEEVNLGVRGADYGWPTTEGPTDADGVTAPLFAYPHEDGASPAGSGPGGFFAGFSIAGGAFYPLSGGSFPAAFAGDYFFADFVAGFVGALDADGGGAYAFAKLQGNPVDLRVGGDGALYVLTRTGLARVSAP